jgi:CRISPR-associated helicase Cas3/CRISPR-associated endonuclease Cas3-HD
MSQTSADDAAPKPPAGLPYFVAHTPSKARPDHWHPLQEHALCVAEMAERFAREAFGEDLATWGRYLGLIHDLGKFSDEFQNYLAACYEAERRGTSPPPAGSAPHKQAGAKAARQALGELGVYLALPLHGHHGGMLSPETTQGKVDERVTEEAVAALRARARSVHPLLDPVSPDPQALINAPFAQDVEGMEVFLRLLYSCLVDADGLDTEAHKDPATSALRSAAPDVPLAALRDTLRKRQEDDFANADDTAVNRVRRAVYADCQRAADLPPGVFTLTVPTGGGKTRSSLAFALEHAVRHCQQRVIYAIPYTSIIDQTTEVFRKVFKDLPAVVLEHHSAVDPPVKGDDEGEEEERWRRLAAENWSAPLIVTTTVQLFESLFSNRPAACRKLHHIARSVIVLDEVQTLPTTLLQPILAMLRTLVQYFGVTVVLCTATQPALTGRSGLLEGFERVTPIVPDPAPHFAALRRVSWRVETEPWDWPRVAEEMRRLGPSALCVVNTRRQALDLLEALDPEGTDPSVLHLSTLLCGWHRRQVLKVVRERLKKGDPILLASTQVIEAGIDLNAPAVLRAIGPLDRVIQAAGRCNREGLRPWQESPMVVFTPAEAASPRGIYKMALDYTHNLLAAAAARGEEIPFDDPEFVTAYFARLFTDIQGEVDQPRVQPDRHMLRYPEVAQKVRLIREDTVSVLVMNCPGAEEEAADILATAERIGGMTRRLWRRAQPLSVNLYRTDIEKDRAPVQYYFVRDDKPGLVVWRGTYDARLGIPLHRDPGDGVVYAPKYLIQ